MGKDKKKEGVVPPIIVKPPVEIPKTGLFRHFYPEMCKPVSKIVNTLKSSPSLNQSMNKSGILGNIVPAKTSTVAPSAPTPATPVPTTPLVGPGATNIQVPVPQAAQSIIPGLADTTS